MTHQTRNQVAQLALNTLETTMVTPDNSGLNISGSGQGIDFTISSSNNYVVRVAENTKIGNAIKTITATGNSSSQLNGTTLELGEDLYQGDLRKVADDYDDFGRPSVSWTYKNDKIGTYADRDNLVATYTAKVSKGDLYNLLSSKVRNAVTADPNKLTVTIDGNPAGHAPADYYGRNDSNAIYTPVTDSSRKGILTEVYVDEDDNVDIVIINTYVFQATSDYSASRDDVKMTYAGDSASAITLNNGELTLYGEDFDIQDIKTDDYLLVTVAAGDVQSVEVARILEGEVTGWVVEDSVSIDDVTYSYSATTLKSGDGVRTTQYTVGQPAIVVLDKYDNIIAVDEAVASSNYVFIKQFGSTSGLNADVRASAYFTDGTKAEIGVESVGGTKSTNAIMQMGSANGSNRDIYLWYTYSINSDGKYVLYDVPTRFGVGTQTATASVANGTAKMIQNGRVDFLAGTDKASALANDKTIMVMIDKEGELKAYTGTKSIPDVTPASGQTASDYKVYFLQDSNKGYVEYAFTDLENKGVDIVDSSENTSFMFVLKYDGDHRAPNATTYYTYKVVDPETFEETTVKFDTQAVVGTGNIFQLFYKPSVNSDDEITRLPAVTTATSSSKYFTDTMINGGVVYSSGSLEFSGTSTVIGNSNGKYVVGDSSKIVLITRDTRLMKDKGNSYEIQVIDKPQTLEGLMDKRTDFSGTIAGCYTSADSKVVDTMYVYIAPEGVGSASIDSVTVDGTIVTGSDLLNNDETADDSTAVSTVTGGAVVSVLATGDGTITYQIKKDGTANYVDVVADETTFSEAAADVDKFDIIKITAAPSVGSGSIVKYVVVKIAKTDVDPGESIGDDVMDASAAMTKAESTADNNGNILKGMEDGAYQFANDAVDNKTSIAADIAGNLADNLFLKWSVRTGVSSGTAMANLVITAQDGTVMYRETATFTSANGGEGHFFYIHVLGDDINNTTKGLPLSDSPLPAGTYTYTISGSNVNPVTGTFTIN